MAKQKCFSHLPAHIFECVSEYISFVFKKAITDANKKAKETNEEKRYTKETKEEKEKESVVAVKGIWREIYRYTSEFAVKGTFHLRICL